MQDAGGTHEPKHDDREMVGQTGSPGVACDFDQQPADSVEVRPSFEPPACSYSISISPGELADRRSILELKASRFKLPQMQAEAKKELSLLPSLQHNPLHQEKIDHLVRRLAGVNMRLWDVEDELRRWEKEKRFGREFVNMARQVYKLNDQRSEIKNRLNNLYESPLKELKQHV